MKEETMTSDFWSVEICLWWRGGCEGNGVECRLKGGHGSNTNTAFHAKELQQFRISGRFKTY